MKKFIYFLMSFTAIVSILSGCDSSKKVVIPNKPSNTAVLTTENYISDDTIAYVDNLNKQLESMEGRLQIGVYITDHIDDLEGFSNELFRKWKPGFSDTNNGAMLVIAINDRDFRIETSDILAIKLPDATAKNILEQAKPYFRDQDYDLGVKFIVSEISSKFTGLKNEFVDNKRETTVTIPINVIIGIGSAFICILLLLIRIARRKSLSPYEFIDFLTFLNSGDSDSGSGSGSGWSGGGGGGGGASSSW